MAPRRPADDSPARGATSRTTPMPPEPSRTVVPPGITLLRSLKGHEARITRLAVTPDGRRLVSGSGDLTVRVWDFDSGKLLLTLDGHSGNIWALAVTPDGRRLVSGSADRAVLVWDLDSGDQLLALRG